MPLRLAFARTLGHVRHLPERLLTAVGVAFFLSEGGHRGEYALRVRIPFQALFPLLVSRHLPREVPTYADAILGFSEEEWNEFALAYAYWQTVSKDAFEELPELRKSNRATPGEGNQRPTKKE